MNKLIKAFRDLPRTFLGMEVNVMTWRKVLDADHPDECYREHSVNVFAMHETRDPETGEDKTRDHPEVHITHPDLEAVLHVASLVEEAAEQNGYTCDTRSDYVPEEGATAWPHARIFFRAIIPPRGGATVAHQAHNLEAEGSSPSRATDARR